MRMFTVLLVVLLGGVDVWAQCYCGDHPTPERAFADSDAVFVGTVTDAEWQWNVVNWTTTQMRNWLRVDGGHYIAPSSHLVATMAIEAVIKGEVPEKVTVHTYPPDNWCGVDFKLGEKYLVYATRDARNGWQLWSGRCSRSDDAEKLGSEIEAITRYKQSGG